MENDLVRIDDIKVLQHTEDHLEAIVYYSQNEIRNVFVIDFCIQNNLLVCPFEYAEESKIIEAVIEKLKKHLNSEIENRAFGIQYFSYETGYVYNKHVFPKNDSKNETK